jgi:hypothetical protein
MMPFRDSAQSTFQVAPSSAYNASSDATNLCNSLPTLALVSFDTLITSSGVMMKLHHIQLVSFGTLIMSSGMMTNFHHIKLVAVTLITTSGMTSSIGKTKLCLISSQAVLSGAQPQAVLSDAQPQDVLSGAHLQAMSPGAYLQAVSSGMHIQAVSSGTHIQAMPSGMHSKIMSSGVSILSSDRMLTNLCLSQTIPSEQFYI